MSVRALAPLLLFLLVGLAFAVGLTKDPRSLPSEMIDRPMPAFELTDLFDEETILTDADFAGEVTLYNVFGSWCVSCVTEHPTLTGLKDDPRFQLIGIDWRDERDHAKRWLARYRNPYERIVFDGDSRLAIDLGVTGAPESFIVDRAGRIRYKHTGIITPEVWQEKIEPVIIALRAES